MFHYGKETDQKLSLRKEVVSTLTKEEQNVVKGQGTTSFGNYCTISNPCCTGESSLPSIPRSCNDHAGCHDASLGKYCDDKE